jgi:hypothetical protein
MQKSIVLSLVIGLMILSSCGGPHNQGSLTMKFNPMFGSNNILLNHTYSAPDGKYYNFQDFKFFLSHIKLVHSDGSMVEVSPMAYISLDDAAALNIPLTNTQGSYIGMQFNIGLDSVQNAMAPNVSDSTNPLFANHYMTWGNPVLEYVFIQLDGYGDNNPHPSTIFSYHVGTNPFYTPVHTISKSFSVTSGNQTVLVLNADIQKIFYGTGTSINVLTSPFTATSQDGSDTALARTFINDFSQTFSLQ